MLNMFEVIETNNMIEHEKLDVRTITMGISLLDCADSDLDAVNEKIYKKITTLAKDLVSTGKDIERDFYKGIGKPELLSGNLSGFWSRRIDDKNRIVYRIKDNKLEIAQCGSHYKDK